MPILLGSISHASIAEQQGSIYMDVSGTRTDDSTWRILFERRLDMHMRQCLFPTELEMRRRLSRALVPSVAEESLLAVKHSFRESRCIHRGKSWAFSREHPPEQNRRSLLSTIPRKCGKEGTTARFQQWGRCCSLPFVYFPFKCPGRPLNGCQ